MGIKRYVVENKAADNCALQKAMRASQWPSAVCIAVASTPPKVFVDVVDLDADPRPFVTAFQSPAILLVVSNKPADGDGIAACPADGASVHTLTIKTIDPFTGQVVPSSIVVLPIQNHMMPASPKRPQLVNGIATCAIGPTDDVCELLVSVRDQAGNIKGADIRLRFV